MSAIRKMMGLMGGQSFAISKISVLFGSAFTGYLSSTPTYGAFRSEANVISASQIAPDAEAPVTGLAYDMANDLIIAKAIANYRFFNRNNAVLGAEVRTLNLGSGAQASAFDSPNQRLFRVLTAIAQYDAVSGTLIENPALPSLGFTPDEGCFFDYETGTLYLSPESSAINNQKRLQKVAGSWSIVDQSWFRFGGPFSIGYMDGKKMIHLTPQGHWVKRDFDYPNMSLELGRQALATLEGTNCEQVLLDPRDYTIWHIFPGFFHGGIVGGEGLFHNDPFGEYRRKLRFPDMVRYDEFALNGNTISGLYGQQVVSGASWIESPVIDFGANTLQQSLANWAGAQFEFRTSNTAPTTSPTAPTDYLPLTRYNANNANKGWGDTVPSAYSASAPTQRYGQFRAKGVEPAIVLNSWKPSDLGAVLKLEFDFTDSGNMYYVPWDSARVTHAINLALRVAGQSTNNDLANATTSQQPVFASGKIEMLSANRNFVLESITPIVADQAGEFTIVAARKLNTQLGLFVTITNTANNNNQLRIGHTRSTDTPANTIGVVYIDGSGNQTTFGFVDTGVDAYSVISVASDGNTIRIFQDNVEKVVIVTGAAANLGQWIGDITPNRLAIGYNHSLAGFSGQTSHKYLSYVSGRMLTTQERSDYYDYLVANGIR